jgi:hypothetical protein
VELLKKAGPSHRDARECLERKRQFALKPKSDGQDEDDYEEDEYEEDDYEEKTEGPAARDAKQLGNDRPARKGDDAEGADQAPRASRETARMR